MLLEGRLRIVLYWQSDALPLASLTLTPQKFEESFSFFEQIRLLIAALLSGDETDSSWGKVGEVEWAWVQKADFGSDRRFCDDARAPTFFDEVPNRRPATDFDHDVQLAKQPRFAERPAKLYVKEVVRCARSTDDANKPSALYEYVITGGAHGPITAAE